MSTTPLPPPIASYIAAANIQNIDAMTACFDGKAVVMDEKQTRHGVAAIREWAQEVSTKYRPTVEVIGLAEADGKTVVTGRVSGDFPGSPIDLRYVFTLAGDKIARLEIA